MLGLLDFSGKVVLVTGGTSGIGKATAQLFVQLGATVYATGRRADAGAALAAEGIRFLPADHQVADDCERVVASVLRETGRLDVLFNNAGWIFLADAEHSSEADWQKILDLNVIGAWRMAKAAIPTMRAQGGGVIVNNASDWGLKGGRGAVAYCSSKGALVQMSKAMALDLGPDRIRVNAVCPGDTVVEWWTAGQYDGMALVTPAAEAEERAKDWVPLGRLGQAEDVARAVVFLASDMAAYITGVALPVDGGNSAQ
ncbi:SDR family NAD(P)-dependent oxidoreductase [Crenobacter caeni]|uniref:SDR family oxidoreductase n=1 Tax=Crenobacter caeni TaxID=2705474 RepID=A0A6B2KSP3_9NEIS|nr:SDR family oxidoreductase [Crenobacter caeni]NDV13158.1 SDR family oxidoreductase [Crenobacter caeni]